MDMTWKWEVDRRLQELQDRLKGWIEVAERADQRSAALESRVVRLERGEFDVPTLTFNARVGHNWAVQADAIRDGEYSPPIGARSDDEAEEIGGWVSGDTEVIERAPKTVDGEDDFRPYPATDLAETVVLDRSRKFDKMQKMDPLNPISPKEAYERGLNAGAEEALRQAEVRVVDYMAQHFSQAMIDGVVGALKGTKGWFNG